MVEELEKMANLNIPKDFSSDETNKYLADACAKLEIKCPPPQTTARLLDKVCLLSFLSFHICVNQGTTGTFHLIINFMQCPFEDWNFSFSNKLHAIWWGAHHQMPLRGSSMVQDFVLPHSPSFFWHYYFIHV